MKTILILHGKRVIVSLRQSWPFLLIMTLFYFCLNQIIIIEPSKTSLKSQPQPPCPSQIQYSLVMSTDELEKVQVDRNWPILRGYEGRDATEETHPMDPMLLERLSLSMRNIKKPLLRVKNKDGSVNARHEWKFEKIIHQTWKSEKIPGPTAPWVKKWLELNPDWTYIFWTDESAREFVSERYPSLLPVYDSWTIPVQKSDMFRIIALYAFGGVYADLDIEPLKPLNEIREWSSCILSREPDLQTYLMVDDLNFWANNYTFTCNAFMACHSHHPFLHYMIGRITRLSPKLTGKSCSLENTILCSGPMFVSLSYGFYRRSIPERVREISRDLDVICPGFEYFMPSFDSSRLYQAQKMCRKTVLSMKQFEICSIWKKKGYTNKAENVSFTNHHWFHSYHFRVNRNRVDIKKVTKPVIWSQEDEKENFLVEYI